MKRLLVVIAVYNGMQWLKKCLDSVASASMHADIFVCDNASTDGSADFVEANYPEIHLVRSARNLGFARSNDIGFRYAIDNRYDFIYLLNQDAWVMPDTFENLIKAFSGGGWGIISPMQMRPDMVTLDKRFKRHYHGPVDSSEKVSPVRFVMAAHWMVSAGCLRKTGLFSPAFSHYGEDNNYCDRARYHGFGIGVLPSATAVHDRQARKKTKEQKIRQNCQYSKVLLSNPNSSFFFQSVWQPVRQCLMSLYWCSMLPLKDIPSLTKEYPSLRKWRKESMEEGAFMDIQTTI